jgi:signal transduction histidine kinase
MLQVAPGPTDRRDPVGGRRVPPLPLVIWRIEQDAGHGVFIISNSNVALETGDLPHVFERFWRKDDARTGATHGGLGLSLAEAFVRLMGGQLRVELPRPDLVRVELRLPARPFSSDGHAPVMRAS